jgi:ABC-type bacteriocin/lantibiotic exporter with double-glycine peptidase domain
MVVLTLIFVLLYAAALFGWIKPLTDMSMITRLEPIIFVIIGYYFGRLPAQQNEKTLKEEINRQTQKADAAQNAKEQAKQDREALEEKLKNAIVVLTNSHGSKKHVPGIENNGVPNEAISYAINSAVKILNF